MKYEIQNFSPRAYQQNIFETSKKKNTLVCLPTGTGKTKNAILLGVHVLNEEQNNKVLILSPTKPLADQIQKEFRMCTTVPEEDIVLLTGVIKPEERAGLFENARVIVATPQTIENDTKKRRISLENVALLVIDECHRSKQKFANTMVVKQYRAEQPKGRILALTASPGATKEKVEEVCKNLCIENVEIRTEHDEDVAPYMQEKKVEYVSVVLPQDITSLQQSVRAMYKESATALASFGVYKPAELVNKRDLLLLQRRFQREIEQGNHRAYSGISIVAKLLKIGYLLELIETQTFSAVLDYIKKLEAETSKAAKGVLQDKRVADIKKKMMEWVAEKRDHPKMAMLKSVMQSELDTKTEAKSIVFANYRSTVDEIYNQLQGNKRAKPVRLVGQSRGFSQKDQLNILKQFNEGEYNIIITTSIGEEGLSIGSLDLAVFYDQTASEIRRIQRTGRVGRVKPGKIVHIVAKGTRDEALLWTSTKKEKKMRNVLQDMQHKLTFENQTKLHP